MGECGCGEMWLVRAYPVEGTPNVLAVDEYHGCSGCGTPMAVTLRYFSAEGWADWGRMFPCLTLSEPLQADAYGGENGHGWTLPLIGKADLVRAAEEGEELQDVDPADYATLADLLADWGLELLQEAMRRRKER